MEALKMNRLLFKGSLAMYMTIQESKPQHGLESKLKVTETVPSIMKNTV